MSKKEGSKKGKGVLGRMAAAVGLGNNADEQQGQSSAASEEREERVEKPRHSFGDLLANRRSKRIARTKEAIEQTEREGRKIASGGQR